MAQHFLLSRAAKTLTVGKVCRMSDGEAEHAFRKVRWAETDGEACCPECGGLTLRVPPRDRRAVLRVPECEAHFSITSGTLFASHKMPLRTYLLAIAIFCNEVKGKSALALSRDLDESYKTALCCPQTPRSDGAEIEGPDNRRRRQGC